MAASCELLKETDENTKASRNRFIVDCAVKQWATCVNEIPGEVAHWHDWWQTYHHKRTGIQARRQTGKKCTHKESYVHRVYIYMHSQKIYSPVTGVDMAFLPPAFKNNDWAETVFLESIDTFTPSSSPRLHTQYIRLPCWRFQDYFLHRV